MSTSGLPSSSPQFEIGVAEEIRTEKPKMFRVLLINDDYTPMDFVVWLLQSVFQKDLETATQIMLAVHQKGRGVCGVYPYDIAQTKVMKAKELAKEEGHPLECILEPEE